MYESDGPRCTKAKTGDFRVIHGLDKTEIFRFITLYSAWAGALWSQMEMVNCYFVWISTI